MPSFKKADLLDLLDDNSDALEKVSDTIIGTSRWSINHALVFREVETGKFFRAPYSVGATEQQDEGPWEHEGEVITAVEVRPVEKVVTVYEPV